MQKKYDYLFTVMAREVFVRADGFSLVGADGKESPWMFDFKHVLLRGDFLRAYTEAFLSMYTHRYPFQVGGLEVGAIPLIVAITLEAVRLGRPVNGFFIRKSRKKTGTLAMIEGVVTSDPIILVDDLIHSGNSFLRQIYLLEQLRAQGDITARVTDVFALLRFKDTEAYKILASMDIKLQTIFELNDFKDELGVSNITDDVSRISVNSLKELWHWRGVNPLFTPVVPKAELLTHDGYIYFGSDNGFFMCLDYVTGKVGWQYHIPLGDKNRFAFSTPVYGAGMIMFGSRDGNVYALDAKTGKRIWVYLEADWIQGNPCVGEELGYVFFPLSFGLFKRQGKVVALDIKTGKKVWEYLVEGPLGGGITYSSRHKMIFFGSDDGQMYALNARSGNCSWQKQLNIKTRGYPTLSEAEAIVFFSGLPLKNEQTDNGYFYACDVATGQDSFIYNDFRFGSMATPCVLKNYVYFTALDQYLYALDFQTGKLAWKTHLGARCLASPTLSTTREGSDCLCVGANNGRLGMFLAKTGQLISVTYLNERILTAPVMDDKHKRLFVATQANEVYALDLTGAKLE